jgi:hypothetical protein
MRFHPYRRYTRQEKGFPDSKHRTEPSAPRTLTLQGGGAMDGGGAASLDAAFAGATVAVAPAGISKLPQPFLPSLPLSPSGRFPQFLRCSNMLVPLQSVCKQLVPNFSSYSPTLLCCCFLSCYVLLIRDRG